MLPNAARTRSVVFVVIKILRIVQPPQTWRPTWSVALEPKQLMQLSINLPVVPDGSIFASFARLGQASVSISHCAHTTDETRYVSIFVQGIFLIIHLHLGPTSLGGVLEVTGQCILSRIVNFSSWWRQATLVICWQSPNQCSAQQQNPKTEGSAMSVTAMWPKRLQCDSPRGSAILCTETSKTNKGVVIDVKTQVGWVWQVSGWWCDVTNVSEKCIELLQC